jgi:hypothetical protein
MFDVTFWKVLLDGSKVQSALLGVIVTVLPYSIPEQVYVDPLT